MDERFRAKTTVLYSTQDIVGLCTKAKPDVVCIDAPLTLPKGRCCLNDGCSCRGKNHFRECDMKLREMGIKFFPLTIGPMRMLAIRGIKIRQTLESSGLNVIESYPGAAQDLLDIPRKTHNVEGLRKGLISCGVGGDILQRSLTHDELDAITCAFVGNLYRLGEYMAIGDPTEIVMILPMPSNRKAA